MTNVRPMAAAAAPPRTVRTVSGAGEDRSSRWPDAGAEWDIVDEWGIRSFPASDPPANW